MARRAYKRSYRGSRSYGKSSYKGRRYKGRKRSTTSKIKRTLRTGKIKRGFNKIRRSRVAKGAWMATKPARWAGKKAISWPFKKALYHLMKGP